jgi:hypothetical protein
MIVVYSTISAVFWGGLAASLFLRRDATDVLINTLVTTFACLAINVMVYSKFMEQLPLWLYFTEAIFAMLALHCRLPYKSPLQATPNANRASSLILSIFLFAFVFYFVFEIRTLFPTYEEEYFLLKMGRIC